MSSVEIALFGALTGDVSVAALVGNRVYPLVAPQDAVLPLIVYQRISTQRVQAHDGGVDVEQLARPRLQLTLDAATYADVRLLADAVRGALLGAADDEDVDCFLLANETDEWGAGAHVFTVRQDWFAWHRE